MKRVSLFFLSLFFIQGMNAQDYVHYSGKTLANVDYHHGQLPPAVGTHNIQTLRANRQYPDKSDGFGWTYNHAPMLAYRNDTFYLQYLSDEIGEHVPPAQVLLQTSKDGYHWTKPVVVFPPYDVPDGYSKNGKGTPAKNLKTVVHQRVGFFTSSTGRLLTMGFYGVCLGDGDSPNDGNGIGRVVREIKADGSFGPIYFIRYNHDFSEKNTTYPFYKKSKDKGFIAACDELLNSPLYMMQWVEEADRNDPLIPLKKDFKAFSYYHLNDGRVVGLWKNGLTSISADNGKTWADVKRAPGVVTGNAKVWGQKLSDEKFATVYDPSEFRWPLAISLSENGLDYKDLWLVHGDITPLRYKGAEKSRGPQYVRGILENNGTPPDHHLWVTYSMNKEDIWVSKIPVPVTNKATAHADEVFNTLPEGKELDNWNIYSPLWAPVSIEKHEGKRVLALKDRDLFDYAKAEKVIPESKELTASFDVKPMQNDKGNLQIEFQNAKGQACTRLIFDKDGVLKLKTNYKYTNLLNYEPQKVYTFNITLSVASRSLNIQVNEKKTTRLFFAPVESIERIVFRTGDIALIPTANTPYTSDEDLPNAGEEDANAEYYISYLKTASVAPTAAILNADDFRFHVDYFNAMEDENIAQAIPNAQSWEWMKSNIPLFECPQKNFEEIYYYRWWTLRKHIKETPLGYAMTEFLVNRNYADKHNMIACAIGHHVYESRWLHNRDYINQYIHAWYRGNEGQPMKQLRKFSSWTTDALYNKYKVDGDKAWLLDMFPDLQQDFTAWDDHLLPSGLYWQEDVRDGMEESISGGRKKQYARPTINSYMYGNAKALEAIALLENDKTLADKYKAKADALRKLIQAQLWNADSLFFETLRAPGESSCVREAIGYTPWYFNLPETGKGYEQAWKQVGDPRGFLAPYGLTTAEQRHPEFRTHGCCKCEWDGAVWPFATAQTMTALANYMNSEPSPIVGDSTYFDLMERYVQSQYHRGKPYIGEYLDETTGYWLKGDQERSRYYNHSTFNDLMITGLVGLRPRADNVLEINPLIPQTQWDWFCLDNVLYHGKIITIVWDKTGMKYNHGKGFYVLVDGKLAARSEKLEKIVYEFSARTQWIGAITHEASNLPVGRRDFHAPSFKKEENKAIYENLHLLALRSIMLRKAFAASKPIEKATVYVSGLGQYNLFLNGKKVSQDIFTPAWSDYDKTVYYNTCQADSLLQPGQNVIGVVLGNGFYNTVGNRYRKLWVSFGPPTLFLELHLFYKDGTQEVIASDESWKYDLSPITFNDIYGGEDYDARLEQSGWNTAGFDDRLWKPVVVQHAPKGELRAQQLTNVRCMEEYAAVSKTKIDSSVVFDMGQNLAGYPAIKVRGKKGQTVKLTPGENLDKTTGKVTQKQTGSPHTYSYTLKGEGIEEWHPEFSYYGFRYIQVDGAVEVLQTVKSHFIYNSVRKTGNFECSNEIFNKAHLLIKNAVKSNMQSLFTDCPTREKLGWLEQTHLNGPGLLYNWDMTQFFPKIMQDIRDAQQPDGLVPTIVPEYVVFDKSLDMFRDSPEWGIACIMLPWMYYQWYGDNSLIENYFDVMRRYVDYIGSRSVDYIASHGLGDWYDYGEKRAGFSQNSPVEVSATAHYYYATHLVSKAAQLLDKKEDAAQYSQLANQIRQAFNAKFFNKETQQYGSGSQFCNAIALYMELVEPQNKHAVLENLKTDIRTHGNRLTTGDVGNRYLFQTLAQNSENELLYAMHNHEDVPGYGFQLKYGATTLTEQWDPRQGASWNHFMMGQIDEWFFRSLAGIEPTAPGFKEFTIQPQVVGDLTYVNANYETRYGTIAVNWKRKNNRFHLSVAIPQNTKATIILPDGSSKQAGFGKWAFECDLKSLKE